ncbi:MAG: DUF4325 domain-containing protein [Bacteroidetes bacterium]|nr:DUF4325 domain-containing protein [Bacteroidota bacterium]
MKEININIFEIIGSNVAVSSDAGQKIFNIIDKTLTQDYIANLNFNNINLLTTAFLNTAIGQLYSKYLSEQLKKQLKLSNILYEDKLLLKKVTDRAKEYFKDKKNIDNIIKDTLGDE